MSKLNPGLYSSEDMTWQTPPDLLQALLKFEGREAFDLDVATTQFNVPAKAAYTEKGLYTGSEFTSGYATGLNGLWALPDVELVWMNPPYGTALKQWMEKAWSESFNGVKVWGLIPARTETIYQHNFGLTKAGFTVFLHGRLQFWKNGKPVMILDKKTGKLRPGNAPFPTMLLYWGSDWYDKAMRWMSNPPMPGTLMVRGDLLCPKKGAC